MVSLESTPAFTSTKNTPVEALEWAFPVRVRRYRLRTASGGDGAAPGGDGIERDVEVLEPCTLSLITERRSSSPWGLAGGEPGSPGENLLLPGGDPTQARRLPDKCTVELEAGDVLRHLTPGGPVEVCVTQLRLRLSTYPYARS